MTRLIADLATAVPTSHLCVYTSFVDAESWLGAILAGAHGYVLKEGLSDGPLLDALITIGRCGGAYTDPAARERLRRESGVRLVLQKAGARSALLTERQLQVWALVGQGKSDKDIAKALDISPKTVEDHLDQLRARLKLPARRALIGAAIEEGLAPGVTEPPES